MARQLTQRTSLKAHPLKPLIARLARAFAAREVEWAQLADARLLRRFRRELDAISQSLAHDESLNTPAPRHDRVRSVCAEILIAARLLEAGCSIEHEVETPTGKHVDFRARRDGATLNVHVKRAPLPTLRDAEVQIPVPWRVLETVPRGLVVALALSQQLRPRETQEAIHESLAFLKAASVGEEIVFAGADVSTAARLRVVAPSTSTRVELVADLSASFDDHVPRFQSTLRKAFSQFMPRSENLFVVCGSSGGIEPFATALLGSNIERWDKRPRAGELIAYGRGGDGFWAGSMRNQSRMAVYWPLVPGAGPLLFLRETSAMRNAPTRAVELARSIFA
ncbi:MAG: hypothetical protein DWH97_02795 [Planctomycetota bacterium]|jgi:hypothetical protein|nr:MAG: hypothetical protein DWH97_02795 [Planctomycetota bacterium]RLS94596.1 MAG: hypothetical protein DWI12_06340 [Planctomycetota bacterium]